MKHKKIRVFVIDDHPVYIEGIRSIFLEGNDHIKIVGSANSAKEAHRKLLSSSANVVLLDLVMPEMSGVELAVLLKKDFPEKKVIALTGENNPTVLYNAWINGVDAILMKYCGREELVETIHEVLEGRRVIGSEVPEFHFIDGELIRNQRRLTPGEQKVLNLLAQGYTRKVVADILRTSENAVDFHCKNLFRKFNSKKLIHIIEIARSEKLIS